MSNTKKIKAGLVLQDPSEFVGQYGTLFYNPDTGTMYLSDGVTPGGISLGQGGGGGGFSGNYNDLTHKPNLLVYATTTYVDNKATWGNITSKPSFATVATTGNYNDLTNKPSIPSISGLASETFVNSAVAGKVDSSSLALVATSGSYNDLEYKPTISTVGHTGNYEDLHNKPTIPSITGLATETYVTTRGYITTADLTGYALATTIPTNVSDLTNDTGFITSSDLPVLSGYALTSDIPTDVANLTDINGLLGQGGSSFSGSYNDLTDKPTLFSGDYTDLTNKPSLFSGSYIDLSDKPTLFSGDYNDLTNLPSIPTDIANLTDNTSLLGQGGTNTGTFGFNGLTMQNTDRSDLTIRNIDLDSNTYDNELYMSTQMVQMYAYNPSVQNWSEINLNNFDTPNVTIQVGVNNKHVEWTFGADSTTTVPGNIQTTSAGFSFGATNITGVSTGTTVIVTLDTNIFGDPFTGVVKISGVVGTTEINGTWYYQASDMNQFVLYTDNTYNTTVDGSAWTAYVSGGSAVADGLNDISISAGTVNVISGGTQWSFTDDGKIHLPAGGDIVDSNGTTLLGNPFDQNLNMNDSATFANVYSGNIDVNKITSNSVTIIPVNSVYCPVNADTIVHVSTQSLQHTIKLILKVEAQENGTGNPETQSCEMMVAKSYNNDKVAGSVYGLVYTGDAALATFNARWNSMNSTIEVTCRPTATAGDAYVSAYITEIGATLL